MGPCKEADMTVSAKVSVEMQNMFPCWSKKIERPARSHPGLWHRHCRKHSYLIPRIDNQSVFGLHTKIMTSRNIQVIAKLLCNLLDISTFHEHASSLP